MTLNLGNSYCAAIIGASGAIGGAVLDQLLADEDCAKIYALSRSGALNGQSEISRPHHKLVSLHVNIEDEASIEQAANACAGPIDLVFIATGVLHDGPLQPEKSTRSVTQAGLMANFAINAIGPMLVMKYFAPKLAPNKRAIMAVLSARVGSISDNRLGGWYGYRASKAALNQFVKSFSVELARTRPDAMVMAIHPGTVQSDLSAPFTSPALKTLTQPQNSAKNLLAVLAAANPSITGLLVDYKGQIIAP